MQELSSQAVEELKLIGADSAEVINLGHSAVVAHCKTSQEQARLARDVAASIGAELVKMKAAVGHGKFMSWVKVNCSFSQKTACSYMQFSNLNHDSNLPDDLSLRQAMVALEIIPGRPREGGSTYRGSHIPSVYDPLNALTKFLGAVDNSGAAQAWEVDPDERAAVQRQYAPKLQGLILRLFGVKVELPALTA